MALDGRPLHVIHEGLGGLPVLSPDGTRAAFTEPSGNNTTVVVVNADGGDRHAIDTSESSEVALAWSPDGRSIVIADGQSVRVVNADGTHLKNIAGSATDAAWQPVP